MASKDRPDDKSPTDQLLELLVYAPVGMIYEYEDVLDKVVKRGKSQLQLARLVGKMAAKRGQNELEENVGEVLETAAMSVARGITQFGQAVGLAPTDDPEAPEDAVAHEPPPPPTKDPVAKRPAAKNAAKPKPAKKAASKKPAAKKAAAKKPAVKKAAAKKTAVQKAAAKKPSPSLPIAGYDDLKAKDIVDLVNDLSPTQRAKIRSYEVENRARKTVLAKIDRLDG